MNTKQSTPLWQVAADGPRRARRVLMIGAWIMISFGYWLAFTFLAVVKAS